MVQMIELNNSSYRTPESTREELRSLGLPAAFQAAMPPFMLTQDTPAFDK
jgi:hypothetical protein